MSGHDSQTVDRQGTAAGVLARLFWLLVGNAILAISLVFILHNRSGFFHAADGVFWITAMALVLVRYLDIRYFHGQTATGAPASIRHWVRYAVGLAVCAAAGWVLAHAVSYLLATRVVEG
jgi:hypothetical protein